MSSDSHVAAPAPSAAQRASRARGGRARGSTPCRSAGARTGRDVASSRGNVARRRVVVDAVAERRETAARRRACPSARRARKVGRREAEVGERRQRSRRARRVAARGGPAWRRSRARRDAAARGAPSHALRYGVKTVNGVPARVSTSSRSKIDLVLVRREVDAARGERGCDIVVARDGGRLVVAVGVHHVDARARRRPSAPRRARSRAAR